MRHFDFINHVMINKVMVVLDVSFQGSNIMSFSTPRTS